MKKFTLPLLLAFLSITLAALATWPEAGKIRLTNGSMLGYDQASATWRPVAIGTNGALPIEGVITIGTATINPEAPPTTNVQATYAAAPAPIAVPSLANRWSFSIFNPSETMTVWASLDGAVASATPAPPSIPIPPLGWISMKLDAAKVLSLAASVTTNVTVYQDGF